MLTSTSTYKSICKRLYNKLLSINLLRYKLVKYYQHSLWHKIILFGSVLFLCCLGSMYGIARWYIASNAGKPYELGTSFIPAYAESLGLSPMQTMDALISNVGVKHFRLVSYWDQLEPSKGSYDFSLLDWQFVKAEQAHATVTLSLGLRQPRWPECHMPKWAQSEPVAVWQPQLENFMSAVVQRYKDSPALKSYQVENEYFLQGFGACNNFDRSRLISEYNLVKKLDPNHVAIVARSNNAVGYPAGNPQPDEFGISIYKRVWENRFLHRYVEYPFPAWYYGFVAGFSQLATGKNTIVHELQAETWTPNYQSIQNTSLDEQNKSFNAARFKDRVEYGRATGMREIYLWGSEYWYYRLVKLHDPSLWQVAQNEFKKANQESTITRQSF